MEIQEAKTVPRFCNKKDSIATQTIEKNEFHGSCQSSGIFSRRRTVQGKPLAESQLKQRKFR